MKKINACFLFLIFANLLFVAGCGKIDNDLLYTSKANTMVRSFSLHADTKILPNLEKIFFTIDLAKGEIYNADSLPYGTNVSALAITATFNNASDVQINYYQGKSPDMINFDYFQSSSTKIDFSHSDDADNKKVVRMTVFAQDGSNSQKYTIKVNVHKVVADSLYWKELSKSEVPNEANNAKSEKYINAGNDYYLFYQDQSDISYCTKTTDFKTWSAKSTLSLPPMQWRTLISNGNAFYVISEDGRLFTCNNLQTLSFTESSLLSGYQPYGLIGFLNDKMIAIVKDKGVYKHAVVNPAGGKIDTKSVSRNFPVSGFSSPVILTSKWGTPQLIIACGTLSDGVTLTNAVWGFDGENWAILNNITIGGNGAPITPRTGATLLSYYTYVYNPNYDVHTKVLTYFIIGGWDGKNALKDLYYTTNLGGIWSAAKGTPLELPKEIKPRLYADAFVINEEKKSDNTSTGRDNLQQWKRMDVPKMPETLSLMISKESGIMVPYIYMAGGSSSIQYNFINEVWKGVIFRLTFPPIK